MAVTAGYLTHVQVCATTAGTYVTLGRCLSVTLNETKETIDCTPLSGAAVAQVVAAGLAKGSVTVDVLYEPGDSGQAILNTAYGDGSSAWFQIKWDNSAGDNVECKILGKNKSATPSGGVKGSWTIVATAAPDQTMH